MNELPTQLVTIVLTNTNDIVESQLHNDMVKHMRFESHEEFSRMFCTFSAYHTKHGNEIHERKTVHLDNTTKQIFCFLFRITTIIFGAQAENLPSIKTTQMNSKESYKLSNNFPSH